MFRFLTLLASLLFLGANASMAAESPARPDGAHLYAQRCSACHGADGRGGVGVPLALPAFLSSVDDAYLRKTVRLGRPGRVMPAFTQLTDAEVEAIVAHIRTWPAQKRSITPSHDRITGNAVRGKTLYERHCTACHGAHGEGGHGTGVTLSRPRSAPILAPALNNPGFLAAASDALIKTTLVNGREGTPMRSFLKQGLKEQDINDIVAYVRAFEQMPPPPGARVLESESPVLVRVSPYSVEETVEKVKTAVGAANMRLIRVQTLDQGFVADGKENHDQTIVYSCDFSFLNEALKVDPRVGLFLPCRVTVIRHAGKVQVMTINPKRLSRIFNNAELNDLCEQMYKVYVEILEESVL
ncbi:MAG: cytochrome [Proteobacteria bacterium]|nr:cytochrome [Pseudomonadota bacterium]